MATEKGRAPYAPVTVEDGTHQNTVVLNDYGGVTLDERTRTSAEGSVSARLTLSIKTEPILVNLSSVDLGRGPAMAIRDMIEEQHGNITTIAALATLERREREKRAYENGDPRARERYDGGRTGPTPPAGRSAVRYGIHSGRLKGGWFVRQNPMEQSWTINVPANRFDPTTWGGSTATLRAFIDRLVSLIPALRGIGIFDDARFTRAVAESKPVQVLTEGSPGKWKVFARLGWKGLQSAIKAHGS